MTEPVMYFGIGFLVAALLGLLVVVRVHNREHIGSVDQFRADVRELEEQLAIALSERSKLQREIVAMKRDAERTWAAERIESALFRERINDVAFEVVGITQALESPDSWMSAYAAVGTGQGRRTGAHGINGASGEASAPPINTGALADRIRALRTVVSRAAPN
jgi:chorismate mutase